jgi:hypothetical protein
MTVGQEMHKEFLLGNLLENTHFEKGEVDTKMIMMNLGR